MVEPNFVDTERYLARLGVEHPQRTDLDTLGALQFAHLVAVPFENLDIVFAGGVPHDRRLAHDKMLGGRGGWCFELNGAFAGLLTALGFEVRMLGAAVLLDGPCTTLEHLALEVDIDEDDEDDDDDVGDDGDVHGDDDVTVADGSRRRPHLVDVGFGDSFIRPLALNVAGAQDGGSACFELLGSPQGTTLAEHVDGVPAARYRFKRVTHAFDDFAPIARSMQVDPAKRWHRTPFATRLLGRGADRVTLLHDSLKLRVDGVVEERPVDRVEWDALLAEWFGMERPGPWPD